MVARQRRWWWRGRGGGPGEWVRAFRAPSAVKRRRLQPAQKGCGIDAIKETEPACGSAEAERWPMRAAHKCASGAGGEGGREARKGGRGEGAHARGAWVAHALMVARFVSGG